MSGERAEAVRFAVVNDASQNSSDDTVNYPEGISEMKFFAMKHVMLGLAVTAMMAGSIPLAAAQSASDAATSANTANPVAASGVKPTKAQRKAARKQARAKKNAELKKLEDAGYQPGQSDPNYPANVQKAEQKAGVGAGASQ